MYDGAKCDNNVDEKQEREPQNKISHNTNADSATIKSDEVALDEASEPHYQQPTSKHLPLKDEHVSPDAKHMINNQYASLNETNRVENNQYTSLAVPQHTAYQELLGQQPQASPSKYIVIVNPSNN